MDRMVIGRCFQYDFMTKKITLDGRSQEEKLRSVIAKRLTRREKRKIVVVSQSEGSSYESAILIAQNMGLRHVVSPVLNVKTIDCLEDANLDPPFRIIQDLGRTQPIIVITRGVMAQRLIRRWASTMKISDSGLPADALHNGQAAIIDPKGEIELIP